MVTDARTTRDIMKPFSWGFAPRPLAPINLNFMKGQRKLIRWFIWQVIWATPQNVAYFLNGKCDPKIYRFYSSELSEMLREKDSELRLKKIINQDGKHAYTLNARTLPTFSFNHDVCLRDVIGKWFHDREPNEVSFERPADANILHYRLEFDNGHMDSDQLKKKIREHYTQGNIQVVFIMRSLYSPKTEEARLKKIFEISKELFYDQPNRILGACYLKFLHNGKLYNRKGEAK
jgi:hypothetical protein